MATHIIRKYANRRLYDPEASRHVTLDEVRAMVVAGDRVRVEDARTGEDITRSVLLQIIMEREEAGRPLLSADLLEKLIRFYGGAMQDFFGTYLEQSVSAFVRQQEALQDQLMKMVNENPVTELTRRNLETWKALQDQLAGAWKTRTQKDDEDGGEL